MGPIGNPVGIPIGIIGIPRVILLVRSLQCHFLTLPATEGGFEFWLSSGCRRGRLRTNSIQPHQPPAANGNAPPRSQQPQQPQQPPPQSQQPPHPPQQACQPPGPPHQPVKIVPRSWPRSRSRRWARRRKNNAPLERSPTSPTKWKHQAVGWSETGGAGWGARSARSKNASC